jgi:hypothetical protein
MKFRVAFPILTVGLAPLLLPLQCCGGGSARNFWNDVLENCAVSDLTKSNVLYFGPSNDYGPGSVLEKIDKNYQPRWTTKDIGGAASYTHENPAATCQGTKKTTSSIGASLALTSDFAPVSGEFGGDFKNTKIVAAGVDSWQKVDLITGPFAEYVNGPKANPKVKDDLKLPNRFIVGVAYKVKGLVATIQFSQAANASVKAKYSGQIASLQGVKVGIGFTGSWTDDRTLELRSSDEFYIAGTLLPVMPREEVSFAPVPNFQLGKEVENLGGSKAVPRP